MKLSILDQAPIPEGFTAGDALQNSIDLARLADRAGYSRYWVAEHHGTPGLACASPEVLIGPIASVTSRIRVGSGGIMLPHYSPLKVAENFNMLSGLFPGRIDLGIGRAAGTSPNVARALQRDRRQPPPDDFPDQLNELLTLIGGGATGGATGGGAEPWLLGSSLQSAIWAAELGLPYVFADFINSDGAAAARTYRQNFRSSRYSDAPRLAVAAWAICADTDDQAMRLSSSFRMMMRLLLRGRLIAVPTVETAKRFLDQDKGPLLYPSRRVITGTPVSVRASLEALAAEYTAEEILIVNILHDHAARLRSYELIADAFRLTGEPSRESYSLKNQSQKSCLPAPT